MFPLSDGIPARRFPIVNVTIIAACFIGGTSMRGGSGTVYGALLGALVITSLDNGMSLQNVPDFLQDIVKGGMKERFDQLRAIGIRTVMITGDNPLTAAAIAARVAPSLAIFIR